MCARSARGRLIQDTSDARRGLRTRAYDARVGTLDGVTSGATPEVSRAASTPPLVVRTVPLELPADASLLDMLPEDHPVTWLRNGDGLVGCGVAAELRTSGPGRFADADAWWAEVTGRAIVRSDVDDPGTGLVAFGTFAFADEPGESTLVVPEVILGRRGDTAWLTTVSKVGGLDQLDRRLELATTPAAPVEVSFADGGAQRRAVDGRRRRGGAAGSTAATSRRSCWPAT